MSSRPRNRLAAETSPYLLQHAENPVDWYPWGPEALARSRIEDLPIFLSIGYAACHWCHVMERESFEDPGTAAILNETFVPIKVDREERPDLDAIYMDAVQALTGHGGWPLSAFLTPAGEPFYAGTYFPAEPRAGMPSFRAVLTSIAEAWRERRDEVMEQGSQITEVISRAASGEAGGSGDPSLPPAESDAIMRQALAGLQQRFDRSWGGFGSAPKFPPPMIVELLLRLDQRGEAEAREMALLTLTRMHEGGIYDHLGGGFARYSVDERWHVPHFEKMLPDNAQLLRALAQGWQVSADAGLREAAEETAAYLLREMRQPEGGFSSSQDADTEGIEGAFATWTWEELTAVVSDAVARCLGAIPEGNWHGPAGPTNVLWRPVSLEAIATELGRDSDLLASEVAAGRRRLFLAREDRVKPATDDKVLASWNGLVIRALAEAGRAMDEPTWIEAAEACGRFCLESMRDPAGRLLRSWRRGSGGGPAFADDHALLAAACLALYETTFDPSWFDEALRLARELLGRFRDHERGGFFQTATDAEPLVVRPKDLQDGSTPSGNSAAAEVLLRLALLTGDAEMEEAGRAALGAVASAMGRAPGGFGAALCALDLARGPAVEVAIVGEPGAPDTQALLAEVRRGFRPNVVLALAAPGDDHARGSVALLEGREQRHGRATAFVCERFTCKLPVTSPTDLADQLTSSASTMEP